jgi:CO dehydrogenase nickel-insertion accessory protein CooC1
MDDITRALLAEIEADRQETEMVLAEIDAALEAYGRSIEQGLALAAEMRNVAAMLEEWSC